MGIIQRSLESLPRGKKFSRLRRAAVSVPSNLAEGDERESKREAIRFCNYSGRHRGAKAQRHKEK